MRKLIRVVAVGMMMFASQAVAGNGDLIVDGNLSVGVSPSAWNTSQGNRALEVSSAAIYGSNFIQNAIFDGTFTWRYKGAGGASIYQQASGNHYWYVATSGTAGSPAPLAQAMVLDTAGNLYVNGPVTANTHWWTSDERYKKNIIPVQNALSTLLKMEGVSYEWKKPEEYQGISAAISADKTALSADGLSLRNIKPVSKNFPAGRHYGVLAQAMEKVLPEAVKTDDNGDKAVNYAGIIPVLIEAIKEQQKMIDSLKAEVAQLKSIPLNQ